MEQQQRSKTLSILIVEDELAAGEVIGRIIAMQFPDAALYFAEDGMVGEELFKKHLPDIVVTDISMPAKSGIEMAREIKAVQPATKIIVLSAYNDLVFQEQCREIGIAAYLLKPLKVDQLLAVIAACSEEIDAAT
jgi:YesN/AraC family two-component response regulator